MRRLYDGKGLIKCLLIHMGPTEFVYYWLHRALHLHSLYAKYHSHHHASFVPEAVTGSVHPFMEHLMYTANFAVISLCVLCVAVCLRVCVLVYPFMQILMYTANFALTTNISTCARTHTHTHTHAHTHTHSHTQMIARVSE